ncbi:hypothetical protein SAMN05443667_108139 [Flavobacterium gillisiae]|uniref:T9SS C-terminal target domain-containing protein n=2 Tax=Flavobacterium gillisiae TaxID=150146 RepID=A0A1H4DVR8_9FLAO|nr:hypothetical protein SAMN05443667_108139 [Flavobacterium gillisiae]
MHAQISGCTDPMSKNFNPSATINDGSCSYNSIKVKPKYSVELSAVLHETSGLVFSDNMMWTTNDDTDTTLYGVDTSGVIQKRIPLKKVFNKDWEEITQDSSYFYIGDFGNNVSGNRKDLHILRIEKKSIEGNIQKTDTISFSYSNQTDFTQLKSNTTNFDCEALVIVDDSIYLFTKQWKQKRTSVYTIPKTPGQYNARLKETFNVKGLITSATIIPDKKLLVLSGYSKTLSPFAYLFYDYNRSDFFSGNKRKIKIALPFHQIEGITTQNGLQYYLTNENFTRKPFIAVPQQLHHLDLSPFLSQYLQR